MTLMERLVSAGYPASDIDHHESDLYVYVSDLTFNVISSWLSEKRYSWECMVNEFTDQITGKRMYDIAFAYDPYWKEKVRSGECD